MYIFFQITAMMVTQIRCQLAATRMMWQPKMSLNLGRIAEMKWPSVPVVRPPIVAILGHLQKLYQLNCCSPVPPTVRPNARGDVKMAMYLPEKVKQVGRTLTKPVSGLPLNGLGLQAVVEQQFTTSALPVINFAPIILDLVLLSMRTSVM